MLINISSVSGFTIKLYALKETLSLSNCISNVAILDAYEEKIRLGDMVYFSAVVVVAKDGQDLVKRVVPCVVCQDYLEFLIHPQYVQAVNSAISEAMLEKTLVTV